MEQPNLSETKFSKRIFSALFSGKYGGYKIVAALYPLFFIAFIFVHKYYFVDKWLYILACSMFYFIISFMFIEWMKLCKKDKFYFFVFPVVLIINYIALSKMFTFGGWMMNHEAKSFASRTIIYVNHFNQGDFFPFWTSSSVEAEGMGMPLPLYYHKLFYYISSLVYIVVNNLKITILLTILFFNFIGIWGIYKISRIYLDSKWTSTILAVSIIFFNYTFTNWFIRGAMAEYSAMMLIPWILWWEINLIVNRKYSKILPVLLLALYFAHSVIAYYSVFSIALAYFIYFLKNFDKKDFIYHLKMNLLSILIFILPVGLHILCINSLSSFYHISEMKSDWFSPLNQFIPFERYLNDKNFQWFTPDYKYTVEFDGIVVVALVISCIAAAVIYFIKQKDVKAGFNILYVKSNIFLVILLAFYILLQLPISKYFYTIVPGADFVQFPWRMLSFIQFLLLILLFPLLKFLNRYTHYLAGFIISLLVLIMLVLEYPFWAFSKQNYIVMSQQDFERTSDILVGGIGEYLPNSAGVGFWDKRGFSAKLKPQGVKLTDTVNCSVNEIKTDKTEFLFVDFNVKNRNLKTSAILPYHFSGIERVFLLNSDKKMKIYKYRTPEDPRIIVELPEGEYTIRLKFACFSNFFIPNTNK